MSERVHTDEHNVITVRLDNQRIDSVVIRNTWRSHYEGAQGLSHALTTLILDMLPPGPDAEAPSAMDFEPMVGPMPDQQWDGFWSEFNLWREKSRRLRQRRAAGEVVPVPLKTDAVEARERVFVDYSGGRVTGVALHPDWVERAGIQELSDVTSEFLRSVDLVQSVPVAPEEAEIDEHRRNALRYIRRIPEERTTS